MARTKWFASTILLFAFSRASLGAEDIKVREQAVRLLERASAVSLIGNVGNYEQVVSFRVYDLDGTTHEGTFTRISAGAAAERQEESYGEFRGVTVRSGDRTSSTVGWREPPEFRELHQQLPVHLGHFDKTDVVRSIENASALGRAALCVQFDTQFGDTLQNNQLCFDAANGALLRWHVGDEVIENTDFVPFAGLLEPKHIRRYLRGALRMEIEQTFTPVPGTLDPNVFTPPTSRWEGKLFTCRTMRRAIGVSTPQPPPGNNGAEMVDVVVHGFIRETGRVESLQIQSSPRPDLNAEALSTVAGWRFEPMICNDVPTTWVADFVVHFQGR